MSPTVEKGRVPEALPKNCFTINLTSLEAFNVSFFDIMARRIGGVEIIGMTQGRELPYIVVGDRMFIFYSDEEHGALRNVLQQVGISGKVQCSGYIDLLFRESGNVAARALSVHASGLNGQISKQELVNYKNEVLKPGLGEHFTIF